MCVHVRHCASFERLAARYFIQTATFFLLLYFLCEEKTKTEMKLAK